MTMDSKVRARTEKRTNRRHIIYSRAVSFMFLLFRSGPPMSKSRGTELLFQNVTWISMWIFLLNDDVQSMVNYGNK